MGVSPKGIGFCQVCLTHQAYPGQCIHGCGPVRQVEVRRPNKYHAQAVEVNGITFASKKEAHRWVELVVLQSQGLIAGLGRQQRFKLNAEGGRTVSHYVADFVYLENGQEVVEDAKGVRTPMYKLKKKWMLAQYGILIREV